MTDRAMPEEAIWSSTEALSSLLDDAANKSVFRHGWVNYIALYIMILLLASIPGNLLTVIAGIKFKELRSPTHLLIINQSVGDLIFAFTGVVGIIPIFFKYHNWPKYFCLFTQAVLFIGLETSVMNLMAITIDRFMAVVFTFQYNVWVTSRRVNAAVCLIWAIVVFIHLIPVMGWNTWQVGYPCQSMWVLPSDFFSIFFIFPVLVALILTAVGNIIIGIIALKKSRKVGDIEDTTKVLQTKTQLKVTKMLLIVVGTFYACWMPYIIMNSWIRSTWSVHGLPPLADFLFAFSQSVISLASIMNPFIYAYKDKNYRRAYCKLLRIKYVQDSWQEDDHSKRAG